MTTTTPPTPYVLAIDIGSSSVRATVYDAEATPLPGLSVATPHVTPTTPDGGAADDALVLADVVERTVSELLNLAGDAASNIVAVGLDTFVGNLLGLDREGQPTTPVYTYADTRSLDEVAQMRRDLDAVDVHQRTGVTLHTAYAPARLLWVRRNNPEAWNATVRWTDFATYLYGRWYGREAACSSSVASWSGLLNRQTGDWDTQLLNYTGISTDQLPKVANYDDVMSGLAPNFASKWPLLCARIYGPDRRHDGRSTRRRADPADRGATRVKRLQPVQRTHPARWRRHRRWRVVRVDARHAERA
jgi:gluconokinase